MQAMFPEGFHFHQFFLIIVEIKNKIIITCVRLPAFSAVPPHAAVWRGPHHALPALLTSAAAAAVQMLHHLSHWMPG